MVFGVFDVLEFTSKLGSLFMNTLMILNRLPVHIFGLLELDFVPLVERPKLAQSNVDFVCLSVTNAPVSQRKKPHAV